MSSGEGLIGYTHTNDRTWCLGWIPMVVDPFLFLLFSSLYSSAKTTLTHASTPFRCSGEPLLLFFCQWDREAFGCTCTDPRYRALLEVALSIMITYIPDRSLRCHPGATYVPSYVGTGNRDFIIQPLPQDVDEDIY